MGIGRIGGDVMIDGAFVFYSLCCVGGIGALILLGAAIKLSGRISREEGEHGF